MRLTATRYQKAQKIMLDLLAESNEYFSGEHICETLKAADHLWEAVMVGRDYRPGIMLRDLNRSLHTSLVADTIWIRTLKRHVPALRRLAKGWGPDEVDVLEDEAAGSFLGGLLNPETTVLRLWWD